MPRQSSYAIDGDGVLTITTKIMLNEAQAAEFADLDSDSNVITVNGPEVTVVTTITPTTPVAVAVTDSVHRDINDPSR